MRRNTRRPSGTWARPRSTTLLGDTPFSSWSIKVMDPLLGCSSPDTVFSTVDFPAPLAPIRVTISPWFTWKETPFTAWMLP